MIVLALLPPFYLDSVVAIGKQGQNGIAWSGTGFIVGHPLPKISPQETTRYTTWLVTNRHVLINTQQIYVRFNSAIDTQSKDYPVNLYNDNGSPVWFAHPNPNIDVAVISVNPDFIKNENRVFQFIHEDLHTFKKIDLKNINISEGDEVFTLGFPMGLVSIERQYVICRKGCIARIRDFLEDRSSDFLIDTFVFPGNSGGPVISCPAATSINGTNIINKANLIGVVKAYLPYRDVAVSLQTGQNRIIFEENSGLAVVESVDSIIETINYANLNIGRTLFQP